MKEIFISIFKEIKTDAKFKIAQILPIFITKGLRCFEFDLAFKDIYKSKNKVLQLNLLYGESFDIAFIRDSKIHGLKWIVLH